jgi:hypothetical protein
LIAALRQLAVAVVFLGIPIALVGLARFAVRGLAAPDYVQIPLLSKLTIMAGVILGVALLCDLAFPSLYPLEQVLKIGGPWDLNLWAFLTTRVNPLALDVRDLLRSLRFEGPWRFLSLMFAVAIALAVLSVFLCFYYWRPPQAVISAAVGLLNVAIFAYVVFYLVCGLLWMINTLNFWALVVILLLYQSRWRAL